VATEIVLFSLVVLLGCAGVVDRSANARRLDRRIARIERKLDAAMDHLGIVVAEPELGQVNALLVQGKKVQAIKAYRDSTGAGLKEAKDAVERLAGQR
jgi:ribosomal protein L7/L12